MDIEQNTLGQKIKKMRKTRRMTQKMLAIGICSQSVLSRIENDLEIPNILVMQQICIRLGITMDQMMFAEFDEIQHVQLYFEKVNNALIHQNYHKMYDLLHDSAISSEIYLDTDMQLYFYYLGTVEYFVDQDTTRAIASLKHSLLLTYTENKKNNISSTEIQIMGCLGRIYADTNQLKKARHYLNRSIDLTLSLPKEHANFELTKIFYHYSRFLFVQNDLLGTIDCALKGVQWAIDKLSYYCVEELLQITGAAYEKLQEYERAQFMYEKAQSVQLFSKFENGVYLS